MPVPPLENTPAQPARGVAAEQPRTLLRGEIADSLLHQGAACLLLITVVLVAPEAQHGSHSLWETRDGHHQEKKDCRQEEVSEEVSEKASRPQEDSEESEEVLR
jgi:hypothetical protein